MTRDRSQRTEVATAPGRTAALRAVAKGRQMTNTLLLPLSACVLAAIPAALAQVKFRVIFDGNSSFYEPVSIAQLSPDVFIWNSRAYYVLSVTPKGTRVATAARLRAAARPLPPK